MHTEKRNLIDHKPEFLYSIEDLVIFAHAYRNTNDVLQFHLMIKKLGFRVK